MLGEVVGALGLERECARCPVLQGHGEVIVVVVDDLAVIVRRLVVLLLGELTRGDFHRVWPLHEVPDHGDSVDARDDDDDGSDNAHRNRDNGVERAGRRLSLGLGPALAPAEEGKQNCARDCSDEADDAPCGDPHEPPVPEVHVPANRRETEGDGAEETDDDERDQVCTRREPRHAPEKRCSLAAAGETARGKGGGLVAHGLTDMFGIDEAGVRLAHASRMALMIPLRG